MSNGSPLAVPATWDLVAPAYADETTALLATFSTRALDLVAPPRGSRIVDVACGPGTLAFQAADRGLLVDAIDFSPRMLAALEARRATEPHAALVTARYGDGQALPYADGTFAAGFSMFGLVFFPDRARGLAELRRVLAPGARAVVSSWQGLGQVPAFAAVFGKLLELLPPSEPPAQPPMLTADACRAEMAAAFADVEIVVHETVQHYASTRELWAMQQRTTAPFALAADKVGPDAWRPLSEQIYAALVAAIGEGPGALTMPAWLSVGTAR
jgi:SAM-dependent methyltransferase